LHGGRRVPGRLGARPVVAVLARADRRRGDRWPGLPLPARGTRGLSAWPACARVTPTIFDASRPRRIIDPLRLAASLPCAEPGRCSGRVPPVRADPACRVCLRSVSQVVRLPGSVMLVDPTGPD